MATYDKGGPIKKKKAANSSNVTTQYVKDIPAGAVPALDASGNQMLDAKGRKMYKKSTMNEPDTKIGQPKKWPGTPANVTTSGKSKGTGGGKLPYKPIAPKGTESSEYFVQDEPTPIVPTKKPITPSMAFGWEGEVKETFGEQGNAPVMVNGKPTKLQTFLVPAQYDQKTGAWNSNTGNMNPTKVRGYVGPDGNFVAVKQEVSPNPSTVKYQGKDIMAYAPESLVPWGNNGEGNKLRNEGAKRASGLTSEQAKITANLPNGTQIKESVAPVNTQNTGFGIGKNVPIEIKKEVIAPTQGLNMSLDRPPVVKPNMEKTTAAFKRGGLVAKYAKGGYATPGLKINDSSLYNTNSNKEISKEVGGLDGAEKELNSLGGTKFDDMSGSEKAQLAGMVNVGGQALASGIDAADRKNGRSSYGGQAASGAVGGATKGFALGTNPALMSATGGLSAIVAPIALGVLGAGKGVATANKDKAEYKQRTVDEINDAVAYNQAYDPKNPNKTIKASDFEANDTMSIKKGLKGLRDKIGFAKGGTIKGEGTGTSDSIETKVGGKGIPAGSFITPAKNNGLAKLIRKDILGDNPNKVAGFKKGGDADMAVSNGEHLFTPKEKQKITAYLGQEILEKLAPESEEGEDKACGGIAKKYGNGGKVPYNKSVVPLKDKSDSTQFSTDYNRALFEINNMYKPSNSVDSNKNYEDFKKSANNLATYYPGQKAAFDEYEANKNKRLDLSNDQVLKLAEGLKNANILNNYSKFEKERYSVLTPMDKKRVDVAMGYKDGGEVKGGCATCGKMKCDCDMKMAKGGTLSKSKAATMLHDGEIRGKKITDQQRKYFAVVASGKAKYSDGGNVRNWDWA